MDNLQLGYACINMQLKKDGVFTSRGLIKKTFDAKGLPYVSSLILQNVKDLVKIIKWNYKNSIYVYRMSSEIMPWMSHYNIKDLPDYKTIANILKGAGTLAKMYKQRLSFHPGQFTVLASPNNTVVKNAINELNKSGEIMDMMGLPRSRYAKINIHVGGAYGDKAAALSRFCKNFKKLNKSAQSRLTIENDDKINMYSVVDLYNGVYKKVNIPIVFDYYHHKFCTGDLTEQQALELAISTWPDDVKPCCHYSESRRKEFLDESIRAQAHSDYIYDTIDTYGHSLDIVIEAKHKELCVQKYINEKK